MKILDHLNLSGIMRRHLLGTKQKILPKKDRHIVHNVNVNSTF